MKPFILLLFLFISLNISAQGNDVDYNDGNTKLRGYYLAAKGTPSNAPGILILPAWMGIDEHSKNSAHKLSMEGYNVFVADIYGIDSRPKNQEEAAKISGSYKSNPELYRKRIRLALDQLLKKGSDQNRIAILGYCFGGTGALEAAREGMPVKAVALFHAGLAKDPKSTVKKFSAKVLAMHGADDPFVPATDVEAFQKEMKDNQVDWQMIFYSGAVHSYTDPNAGNDKSKGQAYNETAARRSWDHMMLFLKEVLK